MTIRSVLISMWQFILRFIRRLFENSFRAAAQRFERIFNEGGQRVCREAIERPASMPPAVVCFDVAECFPLAPRDSVVWAQEFVEHALRMPGVKARKYGAGIEFIPKFVRSERVYTRDHDIKPERRLQADTGASPKCFLRNVVLHSRANHYKGIPRSSYQMHSNSLACTVSLGS